MQAFGLAFVLATFSFLCLWGQVGCRDFFGLLCGKGGNEAGSNPIRTSAPKAWGTAVGALGLGGFTQQDDSHQLLIIAIIQEVKRECMETHNNPVLSLESKCCSWSRSEVGLE